MPSLNENTQAQIERMNAKLKNGFAIDLMKFLQGDKIPVKRVRLNENEYLEAQLWFQRDYKNYVADGYNITLNISKYSRKGMNKLFSSSGLGQSTILKKDLSRRNFNEMAKLTNDLTNGVIYKMYLEKIKTDGSIF